MHRDSSQITKFTVSLAGTAPACLAWCLLLPYFNDGEAPMRGIQVIAILVAFAVAAFSHALHRVGFGRKFFAPRAAVLGFLICLFGIPVIEAIQAD